MQLPPMPRWDVTPAEAMQIQRELAPRVVEHDDVKQVQWVAGIDVGLEGENNSMARAAVVVLQFPQLAPVDFAIARLPVEFPYIPGLLAFREMPVVWQALTQLRVEPDVLIVDGHGRAHPRRLGIASHLGVLIDRVTIGCAKSILCGKAELPANRVGEQSALIDHGEKIGVALRTKLKTTPVYVSVGNRIGLEAGGGNRFAVLQRVSLAGDDALGASYRRR